MSYDIQHNQVVIRTKDNFLLLFAKGGESNVYTMAGKRIVEWNKTPYFFSSEKNYNDTINKIVKDKVATGSLQFHSLNSKNLEGFTELEYRAFKRFDNALKKAIDIDKNLKDIKKSSDTFLLVKEISQKMAERKYSLKDQDGGYDYPEILFYKEDDYESAIKKRMDKYTSKNEEEYEKGMAYREFCFKHRKDNLAELLKDDDFCKEYAVNMDRYYLDGLPRSFEISNEGFSNLFLYRENLMHDIYRGFERDYRELFLQFRDQTTYLYKNTNFLEKLDNDYERAMKLLKEDNKEDFIVNTYKTKYENIKDILSTVVNVEETIKDILSKINKEKENKIDIAIKTPSIKRDNCFSCA